MANYYPLLARAIAGMPDSTAEQRAAVFDRARAALLAQLQSAEPQLSEADIARERLALEDAIRRIEDEAAGLPPLTSVPDEPVTAAPPPVDPVPQQPARPRVAPRTAGTRRSRPLWIVIGLLVPIMAGMGFFAYTLNKRDRAAPVTTAAQQAPAPQANASSKVPDRLGGGQAPAAQQEEAAAAPAGGAAAPATPAAGTVPATAPTTAGSQGVPVAQRAILLQQDPNNAQEVIAKSGGVAWRLDTESPGSGPLETVVKAHFDFDAEKLHGDMIFRRNTDPTLPASHTIEIRFKPDPGSPVGDVKAVGLIEAREDDHTRGVVLGGSPLPVSENVFLIGLSNVEPILSHNLELMRDRNWFYLEMQFSSGRRGAIILERGDVGKRIFAEALDAWKQ